ncbi:hypothetical protein LQ327_33340 [Actinomycetospora endophytica]|uniref:Uncharacterized protein n=1 Tax=Actinomycetospora endophytica TaxID=2291215 RepID=A0ABS8PJ30_9PSEU|nr:hypothetical protein [Actinomycetospora endophytica]MCD2198261.1 hypothetical protein [Actinomycetospora endophytica]
MTEPDAVGGLSAAEARRLRWSWRWLLVELATIVVLLVVSVVPAAHSGPVQWVAMGATGVVVAGGLILGFGVFFYSSPIWPGFEISSVRSRRSPETLWSEMPHAQRRALSRALRRGRPDQVPPGQRLVAGWYAARSVRVGVPQATGQTGLGVLWMSMGLLYPPGTGQWWLHTAAGLLFASVGGLVVVVAPGFWRSLAQLEVMPAVADDDADKGPDAQ